MSNKHLGIIIGIIIITVVGYVFFSNKEEVFDISADLKTTKEQQRVIEQENKLAKLDKKIFNDKSADGKADLYQEKVDIYLDLGRYDDAVASQAAAISYKPDNAKLYTEYYDILIMVNDFSEAEEAIKKAISLNSNSTRWKKYITLYQDHMKVGEERVDELYNQAIASNPQDEAMIIAYARFLETIGDRAKAIQQWQKAILVDPENKSKYDLEIQRLNS